MAQDRDHLGACFRLRGGSGVSLLLRLRGSEALFFGLLSLGACFRLGGGSGVSLLLRLRGSEAIFFSLLSLGPCFRLRGGFGLFRAGRIRLHYCRGHTRWCRRAV